MFLQKIPVMFITSTAGDAWTSRQTYSFFCHHEHGWKSSYMEKTISRVFNLTNTETQSWAVVTGLAASAPVHWYITVVLDQWSDDRFEPRFKHSTKAALPRTIDHYSISHIDTAFSCSHILWFWLEGNQKRRLDNKVNRKSRHFSRPPLGSDSPPGSLDSACPYVSVYHWASVLVCVAVCIFVSLYHLCVLANSWVDSLQAPRAVLWLSPTHRRTHTYTHAHRHSMWYTQTQKPTMRYLQKYTAEMWNKPPADQEVSVCELLYFPVSLYMCVRASVHLWVCVNLHRSVCLYLCSRMCVCVCVSLQRVSARLQR